LDFWALSRKTVRTENSRRFRNNTEKTLTKPYYFFEVDLGGSLCGRAPRERRKIIERSGRFPLTGIEVISIALLGKLRPKHFLLASGSQYGSAKKIFILF
jgi:hypothetical protein